MTIRVGDLLKLPDTIHSELEFKSQMRARELAESIMGSITGTQNQIEDTEIKNDAAGINKGSNWGGGGW